jgi:hypothetical protein
MLRQICLSCIEPINAWKWSERRSKTNESKAVLATAFSNRNIAMKCLVHIVREKGGTRLTALQCCVKLRARSTATHIQFLISCEKSRSCVGLEVGNNITTVLATGDTSESHSVAGNSLSRGLEVLVKS